MRPQWRSCPLRPSAIVLLASCCSYRWPSICSSSECWARPRCVSCGCRLPPPSSRAGALRSASTGWPTLSASDAEKLRAEFRTREQTLEATHSAYRRAQEAVRAALRAEPFDVAAVRSAMADTRAARQALDLALHDVIATAAAQMSPAGRNSLANWSPPHGGAPPK